MLIQKEKKKGTQNNKTLEILVSTTDEGRQSLTLGISSSNPASPMATGK